MIQSFLPDRKLCVKAPEEGITTYLPVYSIQDPFPRLPEEEELLTILKHQRE